MGFSNVIEIEKGILAGKKISVGNFSGIMPFVNYHTDYDWFPQVSGQDNNFRYNNYFGFDIDDFPTYLTQTLGNGTHFMAGIRTSEKDPSHPLAGTFIDITFTVRDINTSGDTWSAWVAVQVCKRVYANDGHVQSTSYPLGNYFPEEEYNVKRPAEQTAQFPWTVRDKCKILCGKLVHNDVENLVVGVIYGHPNGNATCWSYNACRMKTSYFQSANGWGIDAEIPEGDSESPEFGKGAIPKGGYSTDGKHGTFDDSSDTITYSPKPTMHAGMSGFFHAYFVTQTQLLNIGKAMFPTASSSYTDIIDALGGVITSIWNSKKVDCLVDCLVLPISVPFGNVAHVQCGGGDLVYFDGATWQYIEGYPVTDYYVDVDCGDFSLNEYWCNFLDYSGTRIKLFLPYVGFVDLQPEYLNGGSINVKYRFNVIDGSFMCVVHSTSGMSNLEESLIGQYSGMACLHIPITSQNYSNQISGLISSSGMAVTAGLTGNAGMAFGSAMNLANTLAQKPSTAHNNGYNSSSSFLSHRKPYVIIERQVTQFSEQYPTEDGLPSYVSKPLSQIHGFTILDNPVLNIDCNDEEYNEIINLLKTGVIF